MVDAAPQFETEDLLGTTSQYSGVVGVSPVTIPASAGTVIAEALVRCVSSNLITKSLSVSFDGGTTYLVLTPGEFIGWSLKGGVTQLYIKGSVASVAYEIVLNREPA